MRRRILGLLGAVLLFPMAVIAQSGCKFTISTAATEWQFDGAAKGVKPGDRICFKGGTRTGIKLINIHGTAALPVIISNESNSSVIISAPASFGNAVEVDNVTYVRFTGSNNPSVKYGIEITGAEMGINFQQLSSDFEVDHLYVHNTNCVGIVAKTDPTCDASTWRGNFTMKNTSFHDNLISNTGCEGFYIGNSHYDSGVGMTCNGTSLTVKEHDVVNVKVYNNTVQTTGNEGIQVGSAISGCEVHHNSVTNFGTHSGYGQDNGFQAGGGTTQAKVHDNIIDTGNGYCVWDSGGGGIYYNNVIRGGLMGGFSLIDYAGNYAPTGFMVMNNTIVNCSQFDIMMYEGPPTATSRIANNIFVTDQGSSFTYIKYNSRAAQALTVEANNLKTNNIASVKFVNAAGGDFHLLTGSPAINAGIDLLSYGVTVDKDGKVRIGAYDQGAFEFGGTSSNQSPSVNAGSDKTVSLPTTSVALTGTASDPDGSISSYTWTKVSGSTATLTNATTATLSVTGLVAGTYVFRLTVKDNAGATASDDVTVTVRTNTTPIVSVGASILNITTSTTTIIGTASDPDGTISTYTWTKLSGGAATMTNANTATLSLSGLVTGTYVFRLTVKDNSGATAYATKTVVAVVTSTNAAPTVSAGSAKNLVLPTNSTSLVGSASDKDGTIASYAWAKVSGGTCTLSNTASSTASVSGMAEGSYVFRLTVKDNKGAAASADASVSVSKGAITRFSFRPAAASISGWISVAGAPHASVITATDPATTITVSSVATGQWNPANYGTPTSSYAGGVANGTVQPAAVVKNNWFNYNAAYGTTVNGVLQGDNLKLTRLNPAHRYTLQMGASRAAGSGSTDQYGTFEYRVGGVVKTLTVTNNATLQVEYAGLAPNANGEIGISARKMVGSAMNFGYVGWVVVIDLTQEQALTAKGIAVGRTIDVALAPATDDTAVDSTTTVTTPSVDDFVFLDNHYPGGYDYTLVIFDGSGRRIHQGKWSPAMYEEIFIPGELYIYHVLQNGKRIDTGKTAIVQR
ncbi:right-handed parallel beta-helix repeat-containing protein [Chryseolinea soli]|uniref:Right-handed parallel beta-helix repeat-containing protein n=1 Tax=Chryseolinea soli TaxID=2321403 RepID=A0A385SYC6_9BACT|nr:right-handed parallel beta-helix repeat-containing protein [Chryseolinea soli]AYB34740.1 right-handed parallel beta-helix repeat-containing protein [Chryseolinea soli]